MRALVGLAILPVADRRRYKPARAPGSSAKPSGRHGPFPARRIAGRMAGHGQGQRRATSEKACRRTSRIELQAIVRRKLGRRDQLFERANKRRAGDQRLHAVDVEQRRVMVAMPGIGRRTGQQDASGPAVCQRFGTVPTSRPAVRRPARFSRFREELDQRLILLPRGRRALVESLEQVVAGSSRSTTCEPNGTAKAVWPQRVSADLQQLERVGPGQLAIRGIIGRQGHDPAPFGQQRPTFPRDRSRRPRRRPGCWPRPARRW